jgi:hypothetical protein
MQGPIDESSRLLLGISERRLILVRINAAGTVCMFRWWESQDQDEMQKFSLQQLEILKKQTDKVNSPVEIWFMHTEAMLMPTYHFEPSRLSSMLEIVYGPAPLTQAKLGKTNAQDLMHAYRIESTLDQALNQQFPDATREHILRRFPSHLQHEQDSLFFHLTVYATEIRVHLQNGNKTLLHQVYSYSSKEDVLHRLLSICTGLSLQPEQTTITASGMMSKDSALHELLHRSFAAIQFEEFDFPMHEGLNAESYPAHLFSPILAFTS